MTAGIAAVAPAIQSLVEERYARDPSRATEDLALATRALGIVAVGLWWNEMV